MQANNLHKVNKLQRAAISAALPLLQADREVLIGSHSRLDKQKRRRIIDRGIKALIARYDAAIEACNQALSPEA